MDRESVYHAGMRELQDLRDTRRLADRLAAVTMHSTFTVEDRGLIQRCRMFCITTADEHGSPDCSCKGGRPGFVQVLGENTLAVPDYDGNGMYRTWGNVLVNPKVGLLFLDFETPNRMRVNGSARISHDPALCAQFPGAVFVVLVTAQRIFPNCPRYLHRMQLVEESVHVPRPAYTPPVPAWKTTDEFRDALPERDRKGAT
jgi:predicted pyridoxine 5'-phosphate oxidase superfamily flavin-nucleotide-binding protein